ncbi:hypothetical protein EVG20_g2492 [Dentipellis fragilis]|uniref:Uncharacterized protein n=1 Tax=Dentipellis fragilis TaxID=205917 RepID=A0A4Y9Z7U9_9AGAM|nr:hypothetical protein EVG20_g2492 [Dentipellis fragilis]
MKFSTKLSLAALLATSVSSRPVKRQLTEDQVAALAPPLGWKSGIPIAGSANCQGPPVNGVPSQIPCQCPPDQADYIRNLTANANAGKAINNPSVTLSFPLGNSKDDQLARLNAASDTLQNLNGIGKGCPIVSTTFQAQNQAISNGQPIPPSLAIPAGPAETSSAEASAASTADSAPSVTASAASGSNGDSDATSTTDSATPSASASGTPGQLTEEQVAALAPPLGWKSGIPIAGSANCQGPPVNGVPSQIPCQCPPDQDDYIKNLTANANAGKAINNPSVKLSFPLGNSKEDQLARLNAASDTLQNLNGVGKGCPIVSTTFQAQNQAISNGQPIPPSLAIPAGPSETSSGQALVASAPTSTASAATTDAASCDTGATTTATVTVTMTATTAATTAATAAAVPSSSAASSSTSSSAASSSTSSSAPSASASGAPGQLTEDQVAALAPPLGWKNGIPIAGSANCEGPPVNGVPSQIPCQCPPNQDDYIRNLTANANAGKAINNPTVKLSFPLGDSKEDQLARLNAASDTLQNLNGIGKGCPIVSTTFQAQNQAISNGQPIPPSLAIPNAPAATGAARRHWW